MKHILWGMLMKHLRSLSDAHMSAWRKLFQQVHAGVYPVHSILYLTKWDCSCLQYTFVSLEVYFNIFFISRTPTFYRSTSYLINIHESTNNFFQIKNGSNYYYFFVLEFESSRILRCIHIVFKQGWLASIDELVLKPKGLLS